MGYLLSIDYFFKSHYILTHACPIFNCQKLLLIKVHTLLVQKRIWQAAICTLHTGIKMKILAKYTNTCLLCHSYMADKVLVGFHTIFFIIFGPFFNISWFFSCLFTKMGYYKNFFVYNPILTKFGEIVVSMSTTISPNFVKIGLLTKKFL